MLVPGAAITRTESGSRFDLFGGQHTSHVVYDSRSSSIPYEDDGRSCGPLRHLPALRTGETIFDVIPFSGDEPVSPILMDRGGDYWENTRTTWIRHNVVYRNEDYRPSNDAMGGPNLQSIEDKRFTSKEFDNGAYYHVEDSWQEGVELAASTASPRKERTVCYKFGSCPQVYDHDATDESRHPRQAAPTPKGPMPEEREMHSRMHLPYRFGCKIRLGRRPEAAITGSSATGAG